MTTKVIIAAVVGVPLLGFAYYALSPLFNTIQANDALPQQKIVSALKAPAQPQQAPATSPAVLDSPAAQVLGTTGHPASGTARIVTDGSTHFVRYENFKTINGPDIYVYLAKDMDAKVFVSLGKVKATEGNINYEIPTNIDPKEYKYVLTWCKTFGVLFNYAIIN